MALQIFKYELKSEPCHELKDVYTALSTAIDTLYKRLSKLIKAKGKKIKLFETVVKEKRAELEKQLNILKGKNANLNEIAAMERKISELYLQKMELHNGLLIEDEYLKKLLLLKYTIKKNMEALLGKINEVKDSHSCAEVWAEFAKTSRHLIIVYNIAKKDINKLSKNSNSGDAKEIKSEIYKLTNILGEVEKEIKRFNGELLDTQIRFKQAIVATQETKILIEVYKKSVDIKKYFLIKHPEYYRSLSPIEKERLNKLIKTVKQSGYYLDISEAQLKKIVEATEFVQQSLRKSGWFAEFRDYWWRDKQTAEIDPTGELKKPHLNFNLQIPKGTKSKYRKIHLVIQPANKSMLAKI